MEQLRSICESFGWKNVTSYIQSGNIVFQSETSAIDQLADRLHQQLLDAFHFDVTVLVIPIEDYREMVANNPFSKDSAMEEKFQHITFLENKPIPEKCKDLNEMDFSPEKWTIVNRAVYLFCPNGYGNSKLTNSHLERKLGVKATTRNWRTAIELLSIAEKMESNS